MKANELRIGNLVSFKGLWNGECEKITPYSIEIKDNKNFYPADCFRGIPLTPEILEKCGFEKDGFGAYNKSISVFPASFKILSFSGDYLYMREGVKADPRHHDSLCVLWNKDLMKQFYLHQLQNLYYALTVTELPITL